VIVEKPPFLHSSDFELVGREAARAGKRLFVAENYYYRPLVRTLRRLITAGAIGEVRYLIVKALKLQQTGGWRDDETAAGGGALFEGGIHWMNFMGALGLTIESVEGFRPGEAKGIERSMLVVARYAEGAVGSLFHAWDTPSQLKGLRLSRIYGSEGSIDFESRITVWSVPARFCTGSAFRNIWRCRASGRCAPSPRAASFSPSSSATRSCRCSSRIRP
jgi:predicted dehydrogenase